MKIILICIIILVSSFNSIAQHKLPDDSGFTDKSEAKNLLKDTVKEGKWLEYLYQNGEIASDPRNANFYRLTIYHKGQTVRYSKRIFYGWQTISQHSFCEWPRKRNGKTLL